MRRNLIIMLMLKDTYIETNIIFKVTFHIYAFKNRQFTYNYMYRYVYIKYTYNN